MTLVDRIDDFGRAGWIAIPVLSFVFFWPLGFVVLGFLLGSGRMGCWHHNYDDNWRRDRWQRKMDRMQRGFDRMQEGVNRAQAAAERFRNYFQQQNRDFGRAIARGRAATAPSTNTARRRCAGSRRSSASSWSSSTGCATPRTRPNSTSSWPNAAVCGM